MVPPFYVCIWSQFETTSRINIFVEHFLRTQESIESFLVAKSTKCKQSMNA